MRSNKTKMNYVYGRLRSIIAFLLMRQKFFLNKYMRKLPQNSSRFAYPRKIFLSLVSRGFLKETKKRK